MTRQEQDRGDETHKADQREGLGKARDQDERDHDHGDGDDLPERGPKPRSQLAEAANDGLNGPAGTYRQRRNAVLHLIAQPLLPATSTNRQDPLLHDCAGNITHLRHCSAVSVTLP